MRMKITLIIAMLMIAIMAGCSVNPVTGQRQVMLLGGDVQSDRQLGAQAAQQIEQEVSQEEIPNQVSNYVKQVGAKIAAVSHNPDLEWQFSVIPHESVNAFALPGGFIYITTGMLKVLNTEAQLASILAHEAVHVTARHSAADISRQTLISGLISVATNQQTARAMKAVEIVAQLENLRYSRDQETESDLYGLDYLVKAGYDPYAMVETMKILENLSQARPLQFFSTHPSPENRQEAIAQEIRREGYPITGMKNASQYQNNVLSYLAAQQ